jgi:hypothetical protein
LFDQAVLKAAGKYQRGGPKDRGCRDTLRTPPGNEVLTGVRVSQVPGGPYVLMPCSKTPVGPLRLESRWRSCQEDASGEMRSTSAILAALIVAAAGACISRPYPC